MVYPVQIDDAEVGDSVKRRRLAASRVLVGWHLTSLDAPTVAVAWTWLLARVSGVKLPWPELAAMFCAVWVLYAADRLLDARRSSSGGEQLEARHHFHARHGLAFRWAIAAGCVALAFLIPRMMAEELRLYGVLGALLAGWFVVIHTGVKPLPKEFVVGLFFAGAVLVPSLARAQAGRGELILGATLFGALCWLNCQFIHAWEHEGSSAWVVWYGCGLGLLAGILGGALLWAVSLGCWGLVAMHLLRRRVERTILRALADAALVVPVLFLGLWVR